MIFQILFIITFYFTILRYITCLKIFNNYLNSWFGSLAIEETNLVILITWLMWFYQIWFWANYFNLFKN
jgi:hypothetical protein